MREPLKDKNRLEHIISAIDLILDRAEGLALEELTADRMLYGGIVYHTMIIGEAAYKLSHELRQFGIRLEQRELIGVLNTIPLNSLRFVVEETLCTKCSDEVHQEIVDRPVSGVYKVSFVL